MRRGEVGYPIQARISSHVCLAHAIETMTTYALDNLGANTSYEALHIFRPQR